MSYIHIFTPIINSYFPEPHASLMNGILFGQKLNHATEFYLQVQKVGLLHLVVLSGINITFVGIIISNLTKPFGKRPSMLITLIGIALFVLFVGADPPITRAALMGSIALIGALSGRKTYAMYTFMLSGVVVALIKTEWLASVSFQLSCAATLAIMLFGSSVQPPASSGFFKKNIWPELQTSCAAQLFTVPIIFWNFKQISFIAPLSNLVVSFAIPPLMILGFITALLGKIHPIIGTPTAVVSFGLLEYLVRTIELMSRLPGIYADFNGPL